MTKSPFRLPHALLLFLAAGCALPLAAQDAGPMSPPPAASPASQATTQKTPDPSAAAPASAAAAAPAPSASAAPSAAGSVAPPANGTTPNPSAPAGASAPVAPVATPTAKIMVPAGTHIPLVLHNAVSTRSARPGDPVYFETLFPVMIDGKVVIPAGSYVSGEITESKRPGRVRGRGELMMRLTTLILPNAYMVNLSAIPGNAGTGGGETTDNEGKIVGASNKGSDIGTIAKTAGAGAGIGGLATQSAKGVGIGAGVGAAVGLMAVLLTRGPDAELPRGTSVEVTLNRPILLDADKDQFSGPGQASTLAWPQNRDSQHGRVPF